MKQFCCIFLVLSLIVCLSVSGFAADDSFLWGRGSGDGYAMLSHTASNPLANTDLSFRSVTLSSTKVRIANVARSYSELKYYNLLSDSDLSVVKNEAIKAGLNVTIINGSNSKHKSIAVTGWTDSFYSVAYPNNTNVYIGLLCSENGYVYAALEEGTSEDLTSLIESFKTSFDSFYRSTFWTNGVNPASLGDSMQMLINRVQNITTAVNKQGQDICAKLDTLINKITELHNALIVDTPTDKNPGFLGLYNVLTNIDNNFTVNIDSLLEKSDESIYYISEIMSTLGGDVLSTLNVIMENTGLLRLEDIPQIKEAILSIPDSFDTVVTVSSNKIINKQNVIASRLDDIYFQLAEKNNSATIASDVASIRVMARNTYSSVDSILTLLEKQAETKFENITNVTINENNDAYDVFYLTGNDGEKEGIAVFGGRALKAGGKLLNFLFRICFDDAISGIDDTVNNLNNFYFDDSPAEGEGSIWD